MKTSATHRHIAVFLLLAALATPASAEQLSLVINGKSIHVGSEYDWNENNRGIGFEYDFATRSRWIRSGMANAFRDSMDEMSYMGGFGLRRRLFESERLAGMYVDAGLVAFLMTRQDVNDGSPFPGVLPVVAAGNRYLGVNLTYIPRLVVHDFAHADQVDPNIGGVFFLQAKISFGLGSN